VHLVGGEDAWSFGSNPYWYPQSQQEDRWLGPTNFEALRFASCEQGTKDGDGVDCQNVYCVPRNIDVTTSHTFILRSLSHEQLLIWPIESFREGWISFAYTVLMRFSQFSASNTIPNIKCFLLVKDTSVGYVKHHMLTTCDSKFRDVWISVWWRTSYQQCCWKIGFFPSIVKLILCTSPQHIQIKPWKFSPFSNSWNWKKRYHAKRQ
jgi:hypothetical protein